MTSRHTAPSASRPYVFPPAPNSPINPPSPDLHRPSPFPRTPSSSASSRHLFSWSHPPLRCHVAFLVSSHHRVLFFSREFTAPRGSAIPGGGQVGIAHHPRRPFSPNTRTVHGITFFCRIQRSHCASPSRENYCRQSSKSNFSLSINGIRLNAPLGFTPNINARKWPVALWGWAAIAPEINKIRKHEAIQTSPLSHYIHPPPTPNLKNRPFCACYVFKSLETFISQIFRPQNSETWPIPYK